MTAMFTASLGLDRAMPDLSSVDTGTAANAGDLRNARRDEKRMSISWKYVWELQKGRCHRIAEGTARKPLVGLPGSPRLN